MTGGEPPKMGPVAQGFAALGGAASTSLDWLLLCGIRDDNAARGVVFRLDALHQNSVVQWSETGDAFKSSDVILQE